MADRRLVFRSSLPMFCLTRIACSGSRGIRVPRHLHRQHHRIRIRIRRPVRPARRGLGPAPRPISTVGLFIWHQNTFSTAGETSIRRQTDSPRCSTPGHHHPRNEVRFRCFQTSRNGFDAIVSTVSAPDNLPDGKKTSGPSPTTSRGWQGFGRPKVCSASPTSTPTASTGRRSTPDPNRPFRSIPIIFTLSGSTITADLSLTAEGASVDLDDKRRLQAESRTGIAQGYPRSCGARSSSAAPGSGRVGCSQIQRAARCCRAK